MNLLNEIVKTENAYLDRLAQIQEQVEIWMKEMSKEKRLGLKPMDQMIAEADPYNSAEKPAAEPNDTVEFTPTAGVAKPEQPPHAQNAQPQRIHLIYNPTTGEVEGTTKTPMLSRPPAQYIEANADQVQGALKHLEKMNPKLANMLVSGRMSVWIPRAASNLGPSSVKHLGLNTNPNIESRGNANTMKMSPEKLAAAHAAANKMKVA